MCRCYSRQIHLLRRCRSNGTVNGADYQQVDHGFGAHLTGWSNGDFNYDGVVDCDDFTLIDNAFNQLAAQGASPLASMAEPHSITCGSGFQQRNCLFCKLSRHRVVQKASGSQQFTIGN